MMFKILFWLMFDILFVRITIDLWNETGGDINGYLIFCIAAVAFFSYELIHSFKEWLKK